MVEGAAGEQRNKVGGLLQTLASGAVVVVGGLYTVGLLIVNINLSQHGLVTLNLARAEYVMAGALWCFLTAVICGGFDVLYETIRNYFAAAKYVQMVLWALNNLGLVFVATFFVLRPISTIGASPDWNSIPIFLALIANGLGVGTLVWQIRTLAARPASSAGVVPFAMILFDTGIRFGIPPMRIFVVIWALGGIVMYTSYVFPIVHQQFGGGLKSTVQLLLTEKHDTWATDLDLPLSSNGRSVGPVRLLLETDAFFIVSKTPVETENVPLSSSYLWIPTKRLSPAVGIDKKSVTAVRYLLREAHTPK
jgi:hypothetical protein